MSKMLELTGEVAEARRLQEALDSREPRRSFVITDLFQSCQPGGFLHNFQVQNYRLLSSEDDWCPLTADEANATEVLCRTARSAATCHELLTLRCQSFPTALFEVLVRPAAADEIIDVLNRKACLLDDFSLKHLQLYPTSQLLQSEESTQTLAATAIHLLASIYATETLHSRNSRRARYRLTHDCALPSLAMWRQLRACPRWMLQAFLPNDKEPFPKVGGPGLCASLGCSFFLRDVTLTMHSADFFLKAKGLTNSSNFLQKLRLQIM